MTTPRDSLIPLGFTYLYDTLSLIISQVPRIYFYHFGHITSTRPRGIHLVISAMPAVIMLREADAYPLCSRWIPFYSARRTPISHALQVRCLFIIFHKKDAYCGPRWIIVSYASRGRCLSAMLWEGVSFISSRQIHVYSTR